MLLITVLGTTLLLLPATSTASTIHCSTVVNGENVGNNAIQSAIDANPGGVICVAGGTYPEQLTITSSGTQLIGLGTPLNPTVIQPTSVGATAEVPQGPSEGSPINSAILVGGSPTSSISGVSIENVVIDGSVASATLSSCVDFRGITYLDASGSIIQNTIKNFHSPVSQASCTDGFGIEAESAVGGTTNVAMFSNVVSNYDGVGIICNWYASCKVDMNLVSFYAPYESTSYGSEGIQIAYGASGQVGFNTVKNNICTSSSCGNPTTPYLSVGILTYLSGAGTTIGENIVIHNDVGIYVQSDTTAISGNYVSSSTYAGVFEYDGTGTYNAGSNLLANNPIGFWILNDGGVSAFTSIVQKSNYFGHDPIKIQIQTVVPGSVSLVYGGSTHVYSGTNTVDIS